MYATSESFLSQWLSKVTWKDNFQMCHRLYLTLLLTFSNTKLLATFWQLNTASYSTAILQQLSFFAVILDILKVPTAIIILIQMLKSLPTNTRNLSCCYTTGNLIQTYRIIAIINRSNCKLTYNVSIRDLQRQQQKSDNTKMTLTLVWEKNVTGVGICEVSYKIKETECGSKESGSTCRDQGRYEQAVVAWTDTVVQPFAVMIKVSNAFVTRTAMFRIQWSGKHTTIDSVSKEAPHSQQDFLCWSEAMCIPFC